MKNWTLAAMAVSVMALAGCSLLSGAVDVESLQLTEGECVDAASVSEEGEQEVGVLPIVDCSESHYGEVFYTVDVTEDEYPDDVWTMAEDACYAEFEDYVGIAYSESIYYFTATYPTQASWDAGDRQIACMIVGEEGEQLTGSARGTAT